ncbi:uncharacterized protein PV09_09781 [Verruconis gallopava]|uniref:Uncharacterized protein n=1 Tax=Verruconis gallopava TaxID=253628 RepID=A0A0D2AHG9_9PEZI|nr:uncharacterized protein PV09_09781 [Verruconis gallopava]KIV98383.1 hypothetical protein PV09_09781 [Verruconis gallopava]
MAALCSRETTRRTNLRELVLEITKQLSDTLQTIEVNKEIDRKQLSEALKSVLLALVGIKETPYVATLREKVDQMRTETVKEVTKADIQTAATSQEAKVAAMEAADIGRRVIGIVKDIKSKGTQKQATASYAAVAAQSAKAVNRHNPQSARPLAQTHREIIVNIRNAQAIPHLRSMNPRNLKDHVAQAIAQSGETNVKVMSANQHMSRDISIKAITPIEMQALRQSGQEWVPRIGTGCQYAARHMAYFTH